MTTDPRPRPEKRPRPRFDLTGPEWKLVLGGALGLVWTVAWLALAKPGESAPPPAEVAGVSAPPPALRSSQRTLPPPGASPSTATRVAAAPARAPRRAPIRVRTRSS